MNERKPARKSIRAAADTTVSSLNLSGLADCIEEARAAALDNDPGPSDPAGYHALLGRIQAARPQLPVAYQETVAEPYFEKLQKLGQAGFQEILQRDPNKVSDAGLMLDIAQAILQDGEHFNEVQTDAFEEVVADLYDGFLSAQDRSGTKMPDNAILPPMVKWGNPDSGPYTWPIDATASFNLEAAIVNMPPSNARKGLVAWAALGHETCGHDILHADDGLQAEMAAKIKADLTSNGFTKVVATYWADRIDETSSDVMGILNTGPTAAMGLVAYFRALNAAFGGVARLRSDGPEDDPHPADILRGYLGAEVVRLLSFDEKEEWASAIEREVDADLGSRKVTLGNVAITKDVAHTSAKQVAATLASHPMIHLNNHSLLEIQDWRNGDEEIVQQLRSVLSVNTPVLSALTEGVYAAHAVSAAVVAALAQDAPIPTIFSRMIQLLKSMHDRNPVWGPLAPALRGNLTRDFAYTRHVRAAGFGGGTVAQRVFAVLRRLTDVPVMSGRTLDDLNITPDRARADLNDEFFPGQKKGLSEEQVTGDITVQGLTIEINELLGD